MDNRIYIDIGNTNTKWKLRNEYFEVSTDKFSLENFPINAEIWISNVTPFFFSNNANIQVVISQHKYKSLTNSYKESNILGSDRWLAMIAAYELCSGNNFVIIDIGTAVTIDVVNKSGHHEGGLIFPGLKKIRNTFEFSVQNEFHDLGMLADSTEKAWTIGTLNLIVNAINHKIRELKAKFPDALIFLTGGGYIEIQEFLEFEHSYHEHLVLDGLKFYANNMG